MSSPAASLRRRLVTCSVTVVLLLALALDAILYLIIRSELLRSLERQAMSQASVDSSLRKVLVIEALATVLAVGLSALLFSGVAKAVLRPLERMLDVVRRQTAGQRGERIRPEPDCLIGVLGRAYDEMLDAQETAIAETQAARDRSRRFLADAAHQIRTPIAGIQASAETLLRRPTSGRSDEEQLLSKMLQETSRVGRLVSDLLQAARLDQGMNLDPVPCDPLAICRHEVDRVQLLEPALQMTTRAPGWNGQRALLDVKAVHDIMANLLDNARRHAISAVTVTVARVGTYVEVRVADDGPGLSEDQVESVFQRFVSLDGRGGSGLGLPIAQDLARAHGGDLRYQDRAFVVILPWIDPASHPLPARRHVEPEPAPASPAEEQRILQPVFRSGAGG